ncbi:MAG: DnaA regulatory inactivator Hda [Gammaproteobacteria bacterium]
MIASKQLPLQFEFRANQTFDDFYAGPNRDIVTHLQRCVAGSGDQFIFLWGAAGLGKSHLLQASCQEAQKRHISSFYFDLETSSQTTPEVLTGMDECGLVCFDNIEHIAGKPDWESAIFNFFNQHRDLGHKLIVTADCAPAALSIDLVDLKTRLNWGLILKLKPFDDNDKLSALIFKAQKIGLDISPQAGRYLLSHVDRDTVALWSLLEMLDRASLSAQRKLTIPFLKMILEHHHDG